MTHDGVLLIETYRGSLETQLPLCLAADGCTMVDYPSVKLPHKDVIYPNQRQETLCFTLPLIQRSLQEHVRIPSPRAKDREITSKVQITHSTQVVVEQNAKWCLPGSFSPPSPQSLIMSWRVIYELRHVSHDAPICLSCCDRGPGLLSFLSDSSITHLCLLLSVHQNNAVPEWISMSFTLGGTLSLLHPDTREEDMI